VPDRAVDTAGPQPSNPPPGGPKTDVARQQQAKKLLEAAQASYVAGNHPRALDLAWRVLRLTPHEVKAWQIVGASSCYLKRSSSALRAWQRVGPDQRALLRTICLRNGIQLGR
jgi:hypothetical protein